VLWLVRWEGCRSYGDVIPSNAADTRIIVLKQPVGVTAGITPWNLPAATVTRKLAPALAAGVAMVLKAAPFTPLTALAIMELGKLLLGQYWLEIKYLNLGGITAWSAAARRSAAWP
jgi:acyl-CoA reductase-like NAD-dependent aldehyde dehydrogenase